jgi:hypothetical protein
LAIVVEDSAEILGRGGGEWEIDFGIEFARGGGGGGALFKGAGEDDSVKSIVKMCFGGTAFAGRGAGSSSRGFGSSRLLIGSGDLSLVGTMSPFPRSLVKSPPSRSLFAASHKPPPTVAPGIGWVKSGTALFSPVLSPELLVGEYPSSSASWCSLSNCDKVPNTNPWLSIRFLALIGLSSKSTVSTSSSSRFRFGLFKVRFVGLDVSLAAGFFFVDEKKDVIAWLEGGAAASFL